MSQDYFILNKATGKIELHFEKSTYLALTTEQKDRIKSNYLWGRNSGCWISRAKWPNTSYAENIAREIGLEDAGAEGERLSFAEQMQQKAEKAERRADRYEARAEAAEARAEELQKPIESMKGDIAFFTQPNINTSAGRAFTRRRAAMWESWERGFEEFNKSEYWAERSKTARKNSEQPELKNRAFVQRRIEERLADIRKLKRNIEEYEGYQKQIEAGETPHNKYGWEVKYSVEMVQKNIDRWLDLLEMKLDELGFYQDCMTAIGGVQYSQENIKPGYLVKISRYGSEAVEVVSVGPKNFKGKSSTGFILEHSYAEIEKVIRAQEKKAEFHPFTVGDTFDGAEVLTYTTNEFGLKKTAWKKVHCEIVRATEKSVSISIDGNKPIVRKPYKTAWGNEPIWYIDLGEHFIVGAGKRWSKKAS